jgi:hypothetical protein
MLCAQRWIERYTETHRDAPTLSLSLSLSRSVPAQCALSHGVRVRRARAATPLPANSEKWPRCNGGRHKHGRDGTAIAANMAAMNVDDGAAVAAAVPVPVPVPVPSVADTRRHARFAAQLSFYLSDSSLAKDPKMRAEVERRPNGSTCAMLLSLSLSVCVRERERERARDRGRSTVLVRSVVAHAQRASEGSPVCA